LAAGLLFVYHYNLFLDLLIIDFASGAGSGSLVEIVVVLVIAFVAFEFLEHVVFPLIWVLLQRRKQPVTGPAALVGRIAEVIEWRQREGYVFVSGEQWKATSEKPLARGDQVVIQEVEGLTLTVKTLDTSRNTTLSNN
jgi:membrane-bound ClpP family serine protease